jgi:hypothetical protein
MREEDGENLPDEWCKIDKSRDMQMTAEEMQEPASKKRYEAKSMEESERGEGDEPADNLLPIEA